MFVDESKASGLLVCAAVSAPAALASTRRELRGLLLKGQERLHFKHERPARRGEILTRLVALEVSVRVYDARAFGPREELIAREACLRQLVADIADARPARLIIERDESLERHDRRVLFEAVRRHGLQDCLEYDLLSPKSEPMLWIPDAVAWSWAKGGQWRRRVEPLVQEVKVV